MPILIGQFQNCYDMESFHHRTIFLCNYGNRLRWTGWLGIVSVQYHSVLFLFSISGMMRFYFGFEWSIWRLVAFLHFLMQLVRCSFHMNYTIEQFRWYYALDHVLAFQLWYIHSPSLTHFECHSVYDTDSVWYVRFCWNQVLELEKGTKCWWMDGVCLSFVCYFTCIPWEGTPLSAIGCSVP